MKIQGKLMEPNKQTEQDKQKLKRKNLLVGWGMGLVAVLLYVTAIFFK